MMKRSKRFEVLDKRPVNQDSFIKEWPEKGFTAMSIEPVEIARMLVDINTDRKTIVEIVSGLSPARIVEVMNQLNVVEMMMAMQKMRARKSPANQAHITNIYDNPVLIAADAAEGALRGFREEETTTGVARYAPLNAIALLIGSQVGKKEY